VKFFRGLEACNVLTVAVIVRQLQRAGWSSGNFGLVVGRYWVRMSVLLLAVLRFFL
jgi:hypothetical protein